MDWRRIRYALLETIGLNLIIFLIFFVMSSKPETFLSLNLHPLVIVVAVIAIRYGNYLGLAAASISAVTFSLAVYLLGQNLFLLVMEFDYYKFLLIFYLTAVILGRWRDGYERRLADKENECKELRVKYRELEDNYERAQFVKEQLKNQIVGAEESILSLYEIASSLETLDPERVYTEIMEVLTRFLQVKTVSIYVLNERQDFLRLKLRMGADSKLGNSVRVEEHPGLKKVIEEQEPIKKKKEYKEKFPLMAAPIVNQGQVIGIINIEQMEFEMITEYSFNLFRVITDWVK